MHRTALYHRLFRSIDKLHIHMKKDSESPQNGHLALRVSEKPVRTLEFGHSKIPLYLT